MAFLKTKELDPLDPNLFTGPARLLAGVARTLAPTADVPYNEFMRWIYIATVGNVSYVKWDGSTETLSTLAPGVWHPIFSIMINSSGTTATGIRVGS